IMEVWPISRHLEEFKDKYEFKNTQCVFVAQSIFGDTKDQIDWTKDRKQLVIRPYKIADFINYLETTRTLYSADV
ncbi:MAG: AlwI family type II restriction endonuclease, partial [Bacteroidaceae bacterium]